MSAVWRTASAAENGSDTTLVLTIPAGAQVGELAYAFVSHYATGITITGDPAGWTTVSSQTISDVSVRLYTRTLQAGDPGSTITITFSGVNKAAGTLVTADGTHDSVQWAPFSAATTTIATPAASTTEDGSLVFDFLTNKLAAPANITAPAGRTVRAQAFNATSGNTAAAGSAEVATAGAVGSVSYTQPEASRGGAMTVVAGPPPVPPVTVDQSVLTRVAGGWA